MAEEFLCSVPKPTCQDDLFTLSTFLRYVSAGSHMVQLCWNTTCKYQFLPLVTSPLTLSNYVQMHPENVSSCLSMFVAHFFGTWHRQLLPCSEGEQKGASLHFFLAFIGLTRNHPDVGVKPYSCVNSYCLLYSVTCLKWHIGPKWSTLLVFWQTNLIMSLTWRGSSSAAMSLWVIMEISKSCLKR